MKPKVKEVKPLKNHQLELTFDTNEVKIFDVKPYLDKGIFNELKEPEALYLIREAFGSISWPSGQDFCSDTLYEESVLKK